MNQPNDNKINEIIAFLQENVLFKPFSKDILRAIAITARVIDIEGGKILMQQNDPADCFYIVMHGRLRAFRHGLETEEIIGDIGQGEIVGEVGLLIDDVRMASVQAIRDSTLLKFDKLAFQQLLQQHPEVVMRVAKFSIRRLIQKASPKSTVVTIAVLPAGKNPLLSDFVKKLVNELEKKAKTLLLNINFLSQHPELQEALQNGNQQAITYWLNQQEFYYHYIVYEAGPERNDWSLRCIRQADSILWVGLNGQNPELNAIEREFHQEKFAKQHSLAEFVFTTENNNVQRHSIAPWLSLSGLRNYHHVNLTQFSDFAKLIRFLTGTAQGIVLSGGGARALAYIGVLQAMQELKIEIDIIAGTSMGAWLAAAFSQRMSNQEMFEITAKLVKEYYKKRRFTVPFIALMNDQPLTDILKKNFGSNALIEDLSCRFFCVSTNLSRSNLTIHDRGLIWQAVRASVSLPGIFPPFFTNENDLLIDGSIINNLPVDIMRKYINDGNIIAISLAPGERYIQYASALSPWQLLKNYFKPKNKNQNFPTIGKIILKALTLSSRVHEQGVRSNANYWLPIDVKEYGLLDFKSYEQIINKGYQIAMHQLQEAINAKKIKSY